ncbi:MAG: hypothetical protein GSR85_01590 [Desulfurococcales archaeon]|nr:hypothetical protein [Desulfurococcales archaeon]
MEHEHERQEIVYEYIWIVMVIAIVTGFAASIAYYGFALDLNPVCNATPIDVGAAKTEFKAGVENLGGGVYKVRILAGQFFWIPNKIVLENPKRVEFEITSQDVVHGFHVVGTSVNVMVIPGYVAQFTWYPPNDAEGTYLIVCTEYCGVGHDLMKATLEIKRTGAALEPAGGYLTDFGEYSEVTYTSLEG